MSRSVVRPTRTLAAFALGLTLLTPGAFGAPRAAAPAASWNPLRLVARFLAEVGLDAGCGFDPNGQCTPPRRAALELAAGCTFDPSGLCTPRRDALELEAGCGMDPSGLCTPAGTH